MKPITIAKVVLDLGMTVAFLFLMEPGATGISVHERGGIALCVAFIVHLLLNGKWIRAVTPALFARRLDWRTRLGWIVDLGLLAGFSLILVSGLGIAKTVDASWLVRPWMGWRGWHGLGAFLVLAATGVHLGLHADWIRARVRDMGGRRVVAGGK